MLARNAGSQQCLSVIVQDTQKVEKTKEAASDAEDASRVTNDEEREEGSVPWRVYKSYLMAVGGYPIGVLMFFLYASFQLLVVGSEWWLNQFAVDEYDKEWGWYIGWCKNTCHLL